VEINKQDTLKQTALHLASYKNNHTAVARLCAMPGIQLNTLATDGITPLHLAVAGGNIASVRALHVDGLNWNLKYKGNSAIMISVKKNKTEIMTYLKGIAEVDFGTKNKTLEMVAR
jgi:ankyrin repeat protein